MAVELAQFVVFGEALTDFLRTGPDTWRHKPGGACWNVARVSAKLGLRTGFAGAVSKDLFGDELIHMSRESGLDMRYMQQVSASPFLAMVHELNPPDYFFIGEDSADLHFDMGKLPPAWESSVKAVHFGSLGAVREPLASVIIEKIKILKNKGVKLSFDPNWRRLMGPDYEKRFREILVLADFVKVSDEDLNKIFPGKSLGFGLGLVKEHVLSHGGSILYTKGSDGLEIFHASSSEQIPRYKIELADSVGAGDASMGSWMYSNIMRPDLSPRDHAQFAAAAAACACQHHGAWAPNLSEVEELMRGTK